MQFISDADIAKYCEEHAPVEKNFWNIIDLIPERLAWVFGLIIAGPLTLATAFNVLDVLASNIWGIRDLVWALRPAAILLVILLTITNADRKRIEPPKWRRYSIGELTEIFGPISVGHPLYTKILEVRKTHPLAEFGFKCHVPERAAEKNLPILLIAWANLNPLSGGKKGYVFTYEHFAKKEEPKPEPKAPEPGINYAATV